MTTTDPPPRSVDPLPPPQRPEHRSHSEPSHLDGFVRAAVTALGAFTAFSQISEYVRGGKLLDLVFGLVCTLLCLGAVESLRRWLRRQQYAGSTVRPGTLVPATWLLVAAALLVSVSLTVVTVFTRTNDRTAPPTPPPPLAPTPLELVEDFGSDQLDPERWGQVNRPDVVSVVDGRLAFRVTSDVTRGTDLDVRMRPRLPDWQVTEISALATVEQGTGSPGGVAIVVRQESGRESRLSLGPSPAGPSAEPWVCRLLPCGTQYDDFEHPGQEPFADSVPTLVRITHTGERLELVAGSAKFPVPFDPSPIVDVLLVLYAGPDEQWTVTLDELRFAANS